MAHSLSDWVNPIYLDSHQTSSLRKEFLTVDPFSHLQLQEFFLPKKLHEVLEALASEEFFHKESDLFKFKQTHDLKATQNPVLAAFVSFLYSPEFIAFVERLTGLSFSQKTADIHSSLYEDTDFLLCHDDRVDDRSLAFLVYLTTLQPNEGGELALYDADAGEPKHLVKSLRPEFNHFTFFHVSPISFHSVEEVTAQTQRIAIGGWYRGR